MELTTKSTATLVIIKGRRRIGKSRLISEFAKRLPRYRFLQFQGLPPSSKLTAQQERDDFAQQLGRQTAGPPVRADDWNWVFWALAERVTQGKQIIVLDEINWLGSKDTAFLGKLKNAWDQHFSKNPQLILILSGSMSSWIERNILHDTGFLGRVSIDMTLEELPLATCNLFWGDARHQLPAYDKLRLLAVTGGIPRYLEEINTDFSTNINIQRMCFSRDGLLFREFDNIFTDLFSSRSGTYHKLLMALADGPLELDEIYKKLKIPKTGKISEYAEELVQTGLLARDYTWSLRTGTQSKLSRLRLSDSYISFYLKYIEPKRQSILRGTRARPPGLDAVLGLQIQNLVLKNRHAIFRRLSIDPDSIVYDNPFFQRTTERQKGCQIDYLIQTRERTLYICEIKHSKNVIPSAVADEVEAKIASLSIPRRTGYRPVLIYVGEVAEALEDRRYFTLVDFSQLLN
jgi:AAA+ ATPase superfamily predicted ATPase